MWVYVIISQAGGPAGCFNCTAWHQRCNFVGHHVKLCMIVTCWLSFTHIYHSQWLWPYFKVTVVSNNLNRNVCILIRLSWSFFSAGLRTRGEDVTVYVWHKLTKLAHSCLFWSCVYFCLYGCLNCISFHTFSWQLSAFLLCFSGLGSALLVLSTVYLFMKVYFSLDIIPSGWLGSKHQLTNIF